MAANKKGNVQSYDEYMADVLGRSGYDNAGRSGYGVSPKGQTGLSGTTFGKSGQSGTSGYPLGGAPMDFIKRNNRFIVKDFTNTTVTLLCDTTGTEEYKEAINIDMRKFKEKLRNNAKIPVQQHTILEMATDGTFTSINPFFIMVTSGKAKESMYKKFNKATDSINRCSLPLQYCYESYRKLNLIGTVKGNENNITTPRYTSPGYEEPSSLQPMKKVKHPQPISVNKSNLKKETGEAVINEIEVYGDIPKAKHPQTK